MTGTAAAPPTGDLVVEVEPGLVRIRLDDPATGNLLRPERLGQIADAIAGPGAEPDVHGVVITATGPDFCRGKDHRQFVPGTVDDIHARRVFVEPVEALYAAIESTPAIVVSCVQGAAHGLGAALASASDLCIATRTAWFGLPDARSGFPAVIAFAPMVRPGRGSALLHHVLAGDPIPAARAAELGIVTKLVDDDEMVAAVAEVEAMLLANDRAAMTVLKSHLRATQVLGLHEGGQLATRALSAVLLDRALAVE